MTLKEQLKAQIAIQHKILLSKQDDVRKVKKAIARLEVELDFWK